MTRVLLRAPLLTNSGYGVHCRQIFDWLNEKKDVDLTVECLNWGDTPWILSSKGSNKKQIMKIMECSKPIDKNNKFDVSFQVQLPDEWDASLAKKNIGVSAFLETDRCSKGWVEACNKMTHIIVPSTFTKNVVKRSGPLLVPITVVPEWFNPTISNVQICEEILEDKRYDVDTNFNVLIVAQLTSQNDNDDRKNLMNTGLKNHHGLQLNPVGTNTILSKNGVSGQKICGQKYRSF